MNVVRTELLKAVVILALGIAMVVAPGIGDEGRADLSTIPRLLSWAWGRPLGILFTLVGLIGIYAVAVAGRRPAGGDTPPGAVAGA